MTAVVAADSAVDTASVECYYQAIYKQGFRRVSIELVRYRLELVEPLRDYRGMVRYSGGP